MPWHSSDGIRKFCQLKPLSYHPLRSLINLIITLPTVLRRRNTMTTTVSAGDTLLTEARDDDDEEPVPPVAGTSLPGQQSHRFEYTGKSKQLASPRI